MNGVVLPLIDICKVNKLWLAFCFFWASKKLEEPL